MRVTPLIAITPTQLTSSSATEPHAPAAYAGGTTYGFGAIVSVAADYAIYESLSAGNVGHTPLTSPLWWRQCGYTETAYDSVKTNYALGETCSANNRVYKSRVLQSAAHPLPVLPDETTDYWEDMGADNKYAMFDFDRNTQTVFASPLTVVIAPGQRCNTLGAAGVVANSVTISATSVLGGGTVYPANTIDLNSREVLDGYDYAFEPFGTIPSFTIFDLPPYSDIVVTVTFTATTGNVKVGALGLGTYIYIGDSYTGATRNGRSYSTVERDNRGRATLVKRRMVPIIGHKLKVNALRVNKIEAAKQRLDATVALWNGVDESSSPYFDLFTILGFFTQFEISAPTNNQAEITLSVEEV